ncbi:hypothetical protein M422DRAFT_176319 [Sphaerobolus stellatus SS14]|uniref:Glutathione transferase n=1 Tax=Sphaerobolus stellatus (strain SS14) TaxID=990650 RepID=A0A0C9VM47_SPHS4|nr:hypothetical protein M422DRAFT_176319 [Sphaerobolus stellatus SS14]
MSTKDTGKTHHTTATGVAVETVKAHAGPADITLFGGCFCPFVQRVWIALEYLKIPYQVNEVDPYKKPADLLEVSPKGLVPALKLNNYNPPRALNESTVILDYLEELSLQKYVEADRHLLPELSDIYARAQARLQAHHINNSLIPAFYRYLQAQEPEKQIQHGKEFQDAIEKLVGMFEDCEKKGLRGGLWSTRSEKSGELGWADVMAAPWLFRATNVLAHYRGFVLPPSTKFKAYLDRLLSHPDVKSTCSTLELYLDSYERYAVNRPNTSQVADAINAGRALP